MKKREAAIFFILALFIVSCSSNDKYEDAIAMWMLADLNDETAANSQLKSFGDVEFVHLAGEEAKASRARGGDGVAVRFGKTWLDAGQGVNGELNITGKNFSMLVRMKPEIGRAHV